MLCADGIEVVWPHSRASVCTVTSETVEAILDGTVVERWLAISELTEGQLNALYAPGPARETALVYRSYGRRLRAANVEIYALQVGNSHALAKLFGKFRSRDYGRTWHRKDFLRAIMALV